MSLCHTRCLDALRASAARRHCALSMIFLRSGLTSAHWASLRPFLKSPFSFDLSLKHLLQRCQGKGKGAKILLRASAARRHCTLSMKFFRSGLTSAHWASSRPFLHQKVKKGKCCHNNRFIELSFGIN